MNPFIMSDDAAALIDFIVAVFGATDVAEARTVITKPTDFFGDTLSRFSDLSGNIWWVYKHVPATAWPGEAEADASDWSQSGGDDDWSSFTSPELEYIHNTLMDAMGSLEDPRG